MAIPSMLNLTLGVLTLVACSALVATRLGPRALIPALTEPRVDDDSRALV